MANCFSVVGVRAAVTGAGSGIGRAICTALAKKGAHSILALDLDSDSAKETALLCKSISPHCKAEGVHCDASDSASLREVLRAREPVDLFCANAGVATPGDCSVSDSTWLKTFNLNVMQLVWATDELVPVWRERGTPGALLVTASAAGLLTQLGSAPYSAVRTPLALAALDDAAMRAAGLDGVIEPEDVAEEALESLAEGTFLCMPGSAKGVQTARHVEKKCADRERWINGMRRLQRKLLGTATDGPAPHSKL